MPNDHKYTVELGGVVGPDFEKSVNAAIKRLGALTSVVQTLDRSFSRIAGTTETATTKVQRGTKVQRDATTTIDRTTEATRRYTRVVEQGGRAERQFTETVSRGSNALDTQRRKTEDLTRARERLHQLSGKMLEREQQFNRMREQSAWMDRLSDNMREVGSRMMWGGAITTAMGASILAPAKASVDTSASFQRETALLLSRGDFKKGAAGEAQMRALHALAKREGMRSGQGATATLAGIRQMATAGMSPETIMGALPSVIDLALASDSGIESTADLATNILASYSLGPEHMGRFADMSATFANKSEANFSDLATALTYTGGMAASLKMSLPETMGLLGALRSRGIGAGNASMMGTVLNDILGRIAAPSDSDKRTFESLGVNLLDYNTGGVRSDMINVIGEIIKGLQGRTPAEASMLTKDLFGIQGSRGILALMTSIKGRTAVEEAQAMKAATGGSEVGASRQMTVYATNTFLHSVSQIGAAFEHLRIQVGEPLLAPLTAVSRTISGMVESWAKFAEEHPKFAGVIASVIGGLGLAVTAVGALVTTFGSLTMAVGGVIAAMRVIGMQGRAGRMAYLLERRPGRAEGRYMSGYGTPGYNPDIYDSRGRLRNRRPGMMSGIGRGIGRVGLGIGGIMAADAIANMFGEESGVLGDMAGMVGGQLVFSGIDSVASRIGKRGVRRAMTGGAARGIAAGGAGASKLLPTLAPMLSAMMGGPVGVLLLGATLVTASSWLMTKYDVGAKIADWVFKPLERKAKEFDKRFSKPSYDTTVTMRELTGDDSKEARERRQKEIEEIQNRRGLLAQEIEKQKGKVAKVDNWFGLDPITRLMYGDLYGSEERGTLGVMLKTDEVMRGQMQDLVFQNLSGGVGLGKETYTDKAGKKRKRWTPRGKIAPDKQAEALAYLDDLNRSADPDYVADEALYKAVNAATKARQEAEAAKAASAGPKTSASTYAPVFHLNGVGLQDVEQIIQRRINDTLAYHALRDSQEWGNAYDDTAEIG